MQRLIVILLAIIVVLLALLVFNNEAQHATETPAVEPVLCEATVAGSYTGEILTYSSPFAFGLRALGAEIVGSVFEGDRVQVYEIDIHMTRISMSQEWIDSEMLKFDRECHR